MFSMELHDYYGAMCLVRSYVFSMGAMCLVWSYVFSMELSV